MRGIWTALVTPFNEKDEIDFPALSQLLQLQAQAGVAGVVCCGTTGESPTLSVEEKKALILATLKELKNTPVQVVAGVGSNHTKQTLDFALWAESQGVDGLLVVTPYYNRPSQAGMMAHYLAIADAVSCQIIMYQVPSRTGVSLTAETILELAAHPRLRTLKEASGNPVFISELLSRSAALNRPLDILSGDDPTFLPCLSIGAVGSVSVVTNLLPHLWVQMKQNVDQGNWAEAKKFHQIYYPLLRDLFIESNPAPIKWALEYCGLCSSRLRLPLVGLSEQNALQLERTLQACGVKWGVGV